MPAPRPTPDNCNPPDGQLFSFRGSQVSYRTLLFNVFMHPKLAMALFAVVNRYWLLTMCTLLMLCMVGGCGIAMSRVPDYAADIRQTTDFLLETVGTITLKDGRLEWAPVPEGVLPATKRMPHLRVDIMEQRNSFTARELSNDGNDRSGLIVAHDGIRFWRRATSDARLDRAPIPEATITPQVLQNLPAASLEEPDASASAADRKPFRLSRQTQSQICKLVFLSLFISCSVEQFIEVVIAILSSAVIVTLTVAFVIRVWQLRSFFALLLFALNAAIPPAIAALIYRIAELGSDFQTLFAIMLAIYTIYALIEGRNGTVIFPSNQDNSPS